MKSSCCYQASFVGSILGLSSVNNFLHLHTVQSLIQNIALCLLPQVRLSTQWQNGFTRTRKLKPSFYLRLCLARIYVHLHCLATCVHFGRDQIWTQVAANLHFGYISIVLKWFFFATCEWTRESVWPPNASVFTSSTCDYLRLRLTTPKSVWFFTRTW